MKRTDKQGGTRVVGDRSDTQRIGALRRPQPSPDSTIACDKRGRGSAFPSGIRRAVAPRRMKALLLSCLLLSACGNPYALRTTAIEYRRPQTAGSIVVTGPHLYKREALINERREEVKYYTDKIAQIDQVNFTPEIIRDLQVVSALSASLSAKVDPSAGLKYRRDTETSGIQQDIATLRLQLQLDQLKRDAELARAKLPTLTDPVNADLGKLAPDAAINTPSASVASTSLTQLVASVDALTAQLKAGFATNAAALSSVAAGTSPFDTFNDREAYRNLLNGARSSASLDELHDLDGAALIRLNLHATVKPPIEDYSSTFGQLQMTIQRPAFKSTQKEVVELYNQWLSRLSARLSVARFDKNGKFVTTEPSSSFEALSLASFDLFETAIFDYSLSGPACEGVQFGVITPPAKGCSRIMLALPKVVIDGPTQQLDEVSYAGLYQAVSKPGMVDLLEAAAQLASQHRPVLDNCTLPASFTNLPALHGMSAGAVVDDARYIEVLMAALARADDKARALIFAEANDRSLTINTRPNPLLGTAAKANTLLTRLYGRADATCQPVVSKSIVVQSVPQRFLDALQPSDGVRVYEMSPKSRVQIVSSAARAAEAINLAGAVSGQLPSAGVGVDGNVAYGRSATGKADALERVPLVVAYAEAGKTKVNGTSGSPTDEGAFPAFGWMIGPRTTLDAKKKVLRLEQVPADYDLSVDLSVPGAWPYVDVAMQSVWAPDWQGRHLPGGTEAPTRIERVALAPTSHDLDNLTRRVLGTFAVREAVIDSVQPATISACAKSVTFELTGDNIWRATQVVIAGRSFDGDDVKVLPDMRGLLVTIDKAEFPALSGQSATITALTPYGPARFQLPVSDAKPDGTCKATPAPGGGAAVGAGAKVKAKPKPKPKAKPKPAAAAPAAKPAAKATKTKRP